MSEATLYQIFYGELKDRLENESNKQLRTTLLDEGMEMSLEELVAFDRKISFNCHMYLESLVILAAERDYESSITYMNNLIESYKTLVNNLPNHREAITTTFVDILGSIASNIKSVNDVNRMKSSIQYLQEQNINVSSIQAALVVPYSGLIWTEIEEIIIPEQVTENHMKKIVELIDNIKIGISLNLDLESLNDRAADIVNEFIEKDVNYIQILANGNNKVLMDKAMSKRLLNKIKEIHPISETYQTYFETFSTLLVSVNNPKETEEITIPYNDPYPEYEAIEDPVCPDQDNYKLSIQTVKLKNYNINAKIKKYSKYNHKPELWSPQKFKTEIAILERLSPRAKPENCFLKLFGSRFMDNSVEILMENCTTDLNQLISSFNKINRRFDEEQLRQIICPLIRDFAILHQEKIYHKDIKPANILINKVDDIYYPKIADFGCSETFENPSMRSSTNDVHGTRDFMPPEFFDSEDQLIRTPNKKLHFNREKADIFSLGLTILQIYYLTGITCYNFPSKAQRLKKKVEEIELLWLNNLLSNMLYQDPTQRKSFAVLLEYLPKDNTENN